ncbi:3-oxo-tetronate kinase [Lentzea sp. BCCO 10_0061]|uniref:3-oxo-tetronate kinase n=1 Tax=Lentzea sokolovensis TaxID=3095429 RepID=A0ABU4UQC1_9PSEU|nr:3-oxo-tetronate kinase [Lentzea sp. BCCO 10_0061]MDX8141685.1 3-oxo-tetronate kinase [Lentzea sp. BCCO 10_0061]
MTALGCVADDYTGGTDVAAALRRAGLRTVLMFGEPDPTSPLPACDAVVVALKSRTVPAAEAVDASLRTYRWLAGNGVRRTYFKYCSTFDSTDSGNIGPVTDALLDATGTAMTVVCPASPEHGRTTYLGHLFVGDVLLSASSMRHHPLTPMTDPNLVRVLTRQTPHPVGLLPLNTVRAGVEEIRSRLTTLASQGTRHVVVDAVTDADLDAVAEATSSLALLTGGAGLARAVGACSAASPDHDGASLPAGPGVILAGSCSAATLDQVEQARARFPSYRLDPASTPDPDDLLAKAASWLADHAGRGPVLLYSSATPDQREAAVAAMGPSTSEILERTLGSLARSAVAAGARRVVVAGGETSGAVVSALGIRTVLVTAEEDRGVPWCVSDGEVPLGLLLKSGNFGRPDLLVRAMDGAS